MSRKIKVQKHLTINKCCGFQPGQWAWGMAVLLVLLFVFDPGSVNGVVSSAQLPVVIVDPGHGGNDKGALGPAGQQEKRVCMHLAEKLKIALSGKARVVFTRTDDYGVSLSQRASLANHEKADLFISLHTGAGISRVSNGHSLYYDLPPNGDHRQGKSRVEDGPPLEWDRVQQRHVRSSARLAESLRAHLCRIRMPEEPDVLQAPMSLLHGLDMPGVIYEAGYLTHPTMAVAFEDETYMESLAQALSAGILEFLRQGA